MSSEPMRELRDVIKTMSFGITHDQFEYLVLNIDYGEMFLAVEHFLTMLHDNYVPIPKSIMGQLIGICGHYNSPDLTTMLSLIAPQVVEDCEAESVWEQIKVDTAENREQVSTINLEFPNLEKYQRMIKEGLPQSTIVAEVRKDERMLIKAITVLRRLYGLSLDEAMKLWKVE